MSAHWFLFVPPLAEVDHWPDAFDEMIQLHNEVKVEIADMSSSPLPPLSKPYLANYPSSTSWNQTYGSFRHLRRLDENMITFGRSLYLDLCTNRHWIYQVHFIATESGAYLAKRLVEFIDYHGTQLQYGDFDSEWDYFLAKGTPMRGTSKQEPNELSGLIRSVTLIAPSLPAPSGFMRMLHHWALPSIYDHQTLQPENTPGRDCLVVDLLRTDAHIISINYPDAKKLDESEEPNIQLKKRFQRLINEKPTVKLSKPGPLSQSSDRED